jgi:NAD(P)-dependent dehydrogenase (short-subunit alcohol dehydrogenase family)
MSQKKVALVTGGSRGIGLAIVQRLKEEGWCVATCATQEVNLQDNPADFKFVCNVANVESVKEGLNQVLNRFKKIDVLINNAGLSGSNPMDPGTTDELWQKINDVNLNGTYYFCKYTIPHLTDGSGRIINIASILALKGVPDATAYVSAKHGVLGLTRSLAHFLAPRRITVNAICPGWVRTEMAHDRMKEIGITETTLSTAVPLGRFVEPAEVADLAYYLASSSGASMMTGQALSIDGGVSP